MEGFNPYSFMKSVAENGLRAQVRNPGDYQDENGILICGKCGEPRQKFILLDDPEDSNSERKVKLKVVASCRCERDEEERKKRAEEDAKDMEKIQRLRKASLLDEKLGGATFETFKVTRYNERNLRLCKRYAMKFDQMVEKNQGLIFWGSVGTGKSFAAACIANYLLDRKVPVVMTSFVKLLEAFQSGRDEETAILNRLGYAKLVIFDDLGAERGTDYALEKVYNIVDSRYRKNLPMILTTNLTVEEMKGEIDMRYKRVYDRVFETCYPMQFTGPSWRMKEASRRYKDMEELLGVD